MKKFNDLFTLRFHCLGNWNGKHQFFQRILLACLYLSDTHPGSESDEFEDALKGEAHGEGEVHIGEKVGEDERGAVKLDTGQDVREDWCVGEQGPAENEIAVCLFVCLIYSLRVCLFDIAAVWNGLFYGLINLINTSTTKSFSEKVLKINILVKYTLVELYLHLTFLL